VTGASPSLSVVITTYEWPEALDVVLRALGEQSCPPFEVVVADDGSGPETARVVERWQESPRFSLRHVRQENDGWRKARILDLGALATSGDYLVFLDGDCLVRPGFLETVLREARPGTFLAGKRLHLGEKLSRRVLEGKEQVWRWSTARWLLRAPRELVSSHREVGSPTVLVPLRDRRWPWRKSRDFVPPFDAYGFFFGVSRADFERVNGFDLRFTGWGGEDEDIAERLRKLGLTCVWPGPRATLVHLWHPAKKGTMRSNAPLVAETRAATEVQAANGLRELEAELAAETRPG
jgi:glycosyltransferase involved in cell wall biosynthesis